MHTKRTQQNIKTMNYNVFTVLHNVFTFTLILLQIVFC